MENESILNISIFSAVLAVQVERSERFCLHQLLEECFLSTAFQFKSIFVVKLKQVQSCNQARARICYHDVNINTNVHVNFCGL